MGALFADLVGQAQAVALLEAALTKDRVAPAYLFAGPEGVGRCMAALRFLEGVLQAGQSDLRQRRRLEARNHPDLLWVEPSYSHQGRLIARSEADEAGVSKRTPPQVRLEQIREVSRFLARQPLESARGLVVIEDPEAMAESAANALLKTLEEPGHGLLILLSAAPDRLLATIRSRCQQITFQRLSSGQMEEVFGRLEDDERAQAAAAMAQPELVALAAGSPGALLSHADQWQLVPEGLRDRLVALPAKPADALALARDLSEALSGEQQLWLISWWQQQLWYRQGDVEALHRLERLRSHLLSYVQPRLAWEVTLLDLLE
ncbi:MAG: DNA polymerase III subunit delta' [Synechococcus sp. MED-G135]|nr:MAG: DNA polymerase III subunit delta' [Synechococcus sp. MED-G135]|tara:strand:+ start:327 stop:1283 length:957 start_codon:yes stop_codon:yes gene_type:complete